MNVLKFFICLEALFLMYSLKAFTIIKKIVQKFPQEQKKSISTKFDVEP